MVCAPSDPCYVVHEYITCMSGPLFYTYVLHDCSTCMYCVWHSAYMQVLVVQVLVHHYYISSLSVLTFVLLKALCSWVGTKTGWLLSLCFYSLLAGWQ